MSDLIGNPEDRFSQNEAHINCWIMQFFGSFCRNSSLVISLKSDLQKFSLYGILYYKFLDELQLFAARIVPRLFL